MRLLLKVNVNTEKILIQSEATEIVTPRETTEGYFSGALNRRLEVLWHENFFWLPKKQKESQFFLGFGAFAPKQKQVC